MTSLGTLLAGGIFAAGAACVIEGFLLFGRARALFTYAHQLLDSAADLIALVPGKSATPDQPPPPDPAAPSTSDPIADALARFTFDPGGRHPAEQPDHPDPGGDD